MSIRRLKLFIFICCVAFSTMVYSQEISEKAEPQTAPLSIYTDGLAIEMSRYDTEIISNLITKPRFQFRIIRQESLVRNEFSIDFRNIGRKGSTFDYESYRKATLYKYFEVVPDIMVLNRFSTTQFRK